MPSRGVLHVLAGRQAGTADFVAARERNGGQGRGVHSEDLAKPMSQLGALIRSDGRPLFQRDREFSKPTEPSRGIPTTASAPRSWSQFIAWERIATKRLTTIHGMNYFLNLSCHLLS